MCLSMIVSLQRDSLENMMKRIFLLSMPALAVILAVQNAHARQVTLSTKVSPAQLQAACEAVGGSFWSNADGYSCYNDNCDGKGHPCLVKCDMEGNCTGTVPTKIVPGKNNLRGILNPSVTTQQ